MISYVDIVIILLIAVFFFAGFQKGIFVSVLELVRYLIGLPLCFIVSDKYAEPVYDSLVRQKALDLITEQVSNATNKNELAESINEAVNGLPDFVSNMIEIPKFSINQADLSEDILVKVFEPALIFLTKGAIFIIAFLVFFTLTAILLSLIKKARKAKEEKYGKSVLSVADRLVGGAFGICKSFVTIIALATVIMYIQDVGLLGDSSFAQQLESSRMYNFINDINPIKHLLEVKI